MKGEEGWAPPEKLERQLVAVQYFVWVVAAAVSRLAPELVVVGAAASAFAAAADGNGAAAAEPAEGVGAAQLSLAAAVPMPVKTPETTRRPPGFEPGPSWPTFGLPCFEAVRLGQPWPPRPVGWPAGLARRPQRPGGREPPGGV